MIKILSFIVNKNNELLLLKGNRNDPQFKKSFWYVVTGSCDKKDKTREDAVIREIKEETGIKNFDNIIYLNWIFKYNSLSVDCTEYAYVTFVKNDEIILNEENIDYKWCKFEEFIEKIHWFGDKNDLIKVLEKALNNELYFKKEKMQRFNEF